MQEQRACQLGAPRKARGGARSGTTAVRDAHRRCATRLLYSARAFPAQAFPATAISRMSRPITATVVVEGDPPLLAGYRARVNALLDAEPAGPYRELHAAGRLDYRLKASGVPYPPFVEASAEF